MGHPCRVGGGGEGFMKQALTLALALACATLTAAPISPGVHAMVLDIAASLGVPRSVADALQIEESGWYKTGAWGEAEAIGPVDCYGSRARGLFAISQRWQDYLVGKYYPHPPGLFDVFNPTDNALVALGYLADLHRRYGT